MVKGILAVLLLVLLVVSVALAAGEKKSAPAATEKKAEEASVSKQEVDSLLAASQQKLRDAEQREAGLKSEIADLKKKLEQQASDSGAKAKALEQQVQQLQSQVNTLTSDKKSLSTSFGEYKAKLAESTSQVSKLTAEIAELQKASEQGKIREGCKIACDYYEKAEAKTIEICNSVSTWPIVVKTQQLSKEYYALAKDKLENEVIPVARQTFNKYWSEFTKSEAGQKALGHYNNYSEQLRQFVVEKSKDTPASPYADLISYYLIMTALWSPLWIPIFCCCCCRPVRKSTKQVNSPRANKQANSSPSASTASTKKSTPAKGKGGK